MGFKDRLKEAREAKGLKQIDLSAKCGLSKGAVSNYEAGISFPNIATLYKIFDILSVDPNYLFQDEIEIKEKGKVLSLRDKILLKKYNTLNPEGQTKVDEYIDDLSGNPKYLNETYDVKAAAFGGASKTGKVTKSNLNKFNDVLENPME